MQPVLARSSRLALYLVACLTVGGLLSAALGREGGAGPWEAAAVVLPLVIVHGVVCLSSWYVCTATPLNTSRALTLVANIGGATLIATFLWLLLGRALVWVVSGVPGFSRVSGLLTGQTVLLFTVGASLYLLAIAAHYAIMGAEEARTGEQRALEAQLAAREAELKALRSQIEPHFLFNSLNSISALTSTDPAGARRMCVLLGEFLRASLTFGARDRISFSDELAMAARFFEIEQVRFGRRLQVEQSIEPGIGNCLVPPLLLQPIAENAVSHGIAGLLEGGTVRLEARRNAGTLHIVLENPFDASQPRRPRASVGLANVRRRLASHYGGQASIGVEDSDGRFRVTIVLPLSIES